MSVEGVSVESWFGQDSFHSVTFNTPKQPPISLMSDQQRLRLRALAAEENEQRVAAAARAVKEKEERIKQEKFEVSWMAWMYGESRHANPLRFLFSCSSLALSNNQAEARAREMAENARRMREKREKEAKEREEQRQRDQEKRATAAAVADKVSLFFLLWV